jgi:two-component system, sensor histidine kinase and response regulator
VAESVNSKILNSYRQLHRLAERDKHLVLRCTDIFARGETQILDQIKEQLIATLDLEELTFFRYESEGHLVMSIQEKNERIIELHGCAFDGGPKSKCVMVARNLNSDWQSSETFGSVLWVPILNYREFMGAIVISSKAQRQDFSLIGEVVQILAAMIGNYLKQTELTAVLKEEKNRAEKLASVKSEFLAVMSHEIRTPLNGVIGMTELLKEESLTERQQEYANIILGSGESLLCIINDILDFSKIDAGKMQMESIPFNLKKTMREVATVFRLRLKSSPVEFKLEVDDAVPDLLWGDPGRLKQIFNNLLGNAIKFTEQGSIAFSVKILHLEGEDVVLRFEVQDTGIGIAPENRTKIFETFSQEHVETTRKYGGTGLGLSICQKLTELMNGEIGVVSTLGQGSTFWFTSHLKTRGSEGVGNSKISSNLSSLENMHFLVVDDNPNVTQSIRFQLESLKAKTTLAHDGKEALSCIQRALESDRMFDAVISDRVMLNVDGFAFAQSVKANPKTTHLPLVMMTSRGLRGDAQKVSEMGFCAFLTRPIRKNMLRRVLQTVTDPQRLEGELITKYSFEDTAPEFRILVVDDNKINQKVIQSTLVDEGFEIQFANNGKEAVDMVKSSRYQLILMDINMPVMDGLEATGIIRAMDGYEKTIPIIALTANAERGSEQQYLEMGMNGCLIKPFKREQLIALIQPFFEAKVHLDSSTAEGA